MLDIGCGCGDTVLALAEAVGSLGSVIGVDISAPMLAVAGHRIAARESTQAAVLEADAATEPFAPGSADFVFSRFGVMFFGRAVRGLHQHPARASPGRPAVLRLLAPLQGQPVVPRALQGGRAAPPRAGEAGARRARPLRLRGARTGEAHPRRRGLHEIEVSPFDATLTFGRSGEVEDALRFLVQVGPVARALATGTEEQQAAALDAVRERLRQADGPEGLRLGAQCWFVSAVA